jgi:hypothetical protein
MYVKKKPAGAPYGFNDRYAKGDAGYKTAIHHIYMEIVRPGLLYAFYLISQLIKIRRKYGR